MADEDEKAKAEKLAAAKRRVSVKQQELGFGRPCAYSAP